MPWTKPDFVEISLCMEVTAYVNTEETVERSPLSAVEEPQALAGTDGETAATDR